MPALTKVAWDEETQEDVILQPKGCSKRFLNYAIVKRLKNNFYHFSFQDNFK